MIDWERIGDLRAEVGADDFAEVIALFLDDTDSQVAALAPGPDLEARLHYLKGSAMTVGLPALSDLCRAGETAAGRGAATDLDGIAACYARSRAALIKELPRRFGIAPSSAA
ncbi:Hpt domain-containing protein [Pseudooceanicola sp. LIPI14-2-Ac024]|uniref:Hpt domain-containing protein n=1 Tax=Pseudooceanicola sp. LIPI14-2-Ac024 TaxID=3344875 RepID=UPI0035D124F7